MINRKSSIYAMFSGLLTIMIISLAIICVRSYIGTWSASTELKGIVADALQVLLENEDVNVSPDTEAIYIAADSHISLYGFRPDEISGADDDGAFERCKAAASEISALEYTNYVAAERNRRGSVGRLYCPAVGVDVAVFNNNSQATCDAPDSASQFFRYGQTLIGDHNFQGFYKIKNMIPGRTIVYFNDGNTYHAYRCIDKFQGYNEVYRLTDTAGNTAEGKYPNSLMLYTCNDYGGHSITIVCLVPA